MKLVDHRHDRHQRRTYLGMKLRASLFIRTMLRTNLAGVVVRDKYQLRMPIEECIALLYEWEVRGAMGDERMQPLIDRMDRALA